MHYKYKLTEKISNFIADSNLQEINIGCSDSQVIRIDKNEDIYFLKMAKNGVLTKEFEKLKWLEGKLNVPKIVIYDLNDETEYLITEAVRGEMVCSDYYLNNPLVGIKVIAEAFKQVYSVNIADCPFNVSIDYKLDLVENNLKNGLILEENVSEKVLEKYGDLNNILTFLKENRFEEQPCFSHGDTSLPNIFADKDHFSGFIDVGECGIADKWFDLAICEKSIIRNYGEKYIYNFYEELNIKPDREKIDYYLLMMQLYL